MQERPSNTPERVIANNPEYAQLAESYGIGQDWPAN